MKIVSLVNMKGGVSKTTLAVNIADCLNRRLDQRVLLIDLDPQFNATQCIIDGEKYVEMRKGGQNTVYDVFNDAAQPQHSLVDGQTELKPTAMEDIEPWPIRDKFDILPGDLELYRLEFGGGQGRELRLKRFLKHIEKLDKYDYVLIDTPPTPSGWMMSALIASQYYLIPVKAEPLSRTGIDLLRGIVNKCTENFALDIECLGVVLTQVDARTRVFTDTKVWLDGNAVWKDKRFSSHLPQRTKIANLQGEQMLILDSGITDAMAALVRITRQMIERIEDVGPKK